MPGFLDWVSLFVQRVAGCLATRGAGSHSDYTFGFSPARRSSRICFHFWICCGVRKGRICWKEEARICRICCRFCFCGSAVFSRRALICCRVLSTMGLIFAICSRVSSNSFLSFWKRGLRFPVVCVPAPGVDGWVDGVVGAGSLGSGGSRESPGGTGGSGSLARRSTAKTGSEARPSKIAVTGAHKRGVFIAEINPCFRLRFREKCRLGSRRTCDPPKTGPTAH